MSAPLRRGVVPMWSRRCLPALLIAASAIVPPADAQPQQPVFARVQIAVPAAAPATAPWLNPALSADTRAGLVLNALSLDEALQLVEGRYAVPANFKLPPNVKPPGAIGSAGYVPGVPRLGIPALQESDAGVGVADPIDGITGQPVRGTAGYSTALPAGLATAATWNPTLAYDGGAMIGSEAHAEGFNVLLAGGLDLARDPRNGRNFEYAGEDPLLAGTIVGNEVRGIQAAHVISTIKHYALNDQETGRNTLSSDIAWSAAWASDLLAFEIGIEIGDPGSIMCSYNRVNTVYACSNSILLNDVLKAHWGYRGWVMSDWGAVHSTDDALAGLDQESGDYFDQPNFYFGAPLKAAVVSGHVPRARLYDMDRRILRSMFAVGVVDHPPVIEPIDAANDANVAQADEEQAAVLLKNANGALPLSKDAGSIAVIGMHADAGVLEGGGSSEVWPVGGPAVPLDSLAFPHPVIWDPSAPLAFIRAEAPNARVRFDDGSNIAAAVQAARGASTAVVFAYQWLAESLDAPNLSLPGNQDQLIAAVAAANPHTVVVLETGDPVKMPWLNAVGAVVEAWYPGQHGGQAIARILFGDVDPSGRLPITFPQSEAQLPRPVLDGLANPNAFFDVNYNIEGADVGYKWYDLKHLTPLFPFGFGLSYTTFSYANLQISTTAAGDLVLSFDDTNTGSRAGLDVAQLYLRLPDGQGNIVKHLAGFQKVALAAGQTRRVSIVADPRAVGVFDAASAALRVPGGQYAALLSSSSADADIKLQAAAVMSGRSVSPPRSVSGS